MDEKKEVKEFTTEELAQCIPAPADLKAPFVFEVEGVPMVAKPVGRHSWEVTGREISCRLLPGSKTFSSSSMTLNRSANMSRITKLIQQIFI